LKSKILLLISFKSKGFYNLFRYVFYLKIIKLMNKRVKVKKKVKGQGKEHLQNYKQQLTSRPNAKNKNWMEIIITPSNKHQYPSNNRSYLRNKINEMLKISLNILIKQTIYKTRNQIQRNVYKE
jgi:hypothetical protein